MSAPVRASDNIPAAPGGWADADWRSCVKTLRQVSLISTVFQNFLQPILFYPSFQKAYPTLTEAFQGSIAPYSPKAELFSAVKFSDRLDSEEINKSYKLIKATFKPLCDGNSLSIGDADCWIAVSFCRSLLDHLGKNPDPSSCFTAKREELEDLIKKIDEAHLATKLTTIIDFEHYISVAQKTILCAAEFLARARKPRLDETARRKAFDTLLPGLLGQMKGCLLPLERDIKALPLIGETCILELLRPQPGAIEEIGARAKLKALLLLSQQGDPSTKCALRTKAKEFCSTLQTLSERLNRKAREKDLEAQRTGVTKRVG